MSPLYTSAFTHIHTQLYIFVSLICVLCGSLMNCRYRRGLSNNCTEGTLLKYSPRRQKCPSHAPRGLQLFTSEGTLVASLERNVTFLVFLEEVLTLLYRSNSSVCITVLGCMLFLQSFIFVSRCCQRHTAEAGAPAK